MRRGNIEVVANPPNVAENIRIDLFVWEGNQRIYKTGLHIFKFQTVEDTLPAIINHFHIVLENYYHEKR